MISKFLGLVRVDVEQTTDDLVFKTRLLRYNNDYYPRTILEETR